MALQLRIFIGFGLGGMREALTITSTKKKACVNVSQIHYDAHFAKHEPRPSTARSSDLPHRPDQAKTW